MWDTAELVAKGSRFAAAPTPVETIYSVGADSGPGSDAYRASSATISSAPEVAASIPDRKGSFVVVAAPASKSTSWFQ